MVTPSPLSFNTCGFRKCLIQLRFVESEIECLWIPGQSDLMLNLTASRGESLRLRRWLSDVWSPFVRNVQVAWIFQVAACFQVGQVEANLQVRGVVPAGKVVRCDDMFWQRESRVAF